MKKLEVANLDISKKIEFLEHVFDDMGQRGQSGYLLGGDTGVGKTSFIRDLSALLGLDLIMIETPHIVEEHIIDIPFIVVKPNQSEKKGTTRIDQTTERQEFDIQFAKSHLYTALTKSAKMPDAQLLAVINGREDLMLVWKELGGTAEKIPAEITKLRGMYKTILFLDEYFRQTSSSIRNMLRSILNGRIGSNALPKDVYTIFASNLVDQGVGEILQNEDFKQLDFDTPDLDSWFAYLISKYKKNPKVQLDDELVHDFYQLMKKNAGSLSLDDVAADVRVSPRRWEQLMVYLATSLPVKDQRDADLLLKNVAINFQNYITTERAAIAKDVMDTVKALIKKNQKIDADEKNVDDSDWRETLEHQIQTRMKAGEARKYVPVIAGPPGAGKTRHINDLATDLNLVPVIIDVQNTSPEEAIGIPLATKGAPDKTGRSDLDVSFSRPPLFDDIQNQMRIGETHLKERLVKFHGDKEGAALFAKWQKADVKYLIFFDELNRTNVKVFNAMRKVLLEKEFNSEYKLPKESVLVAAINPESNGVIELTKHVRDVFDVVPVGLSWSKFKKHLDTVKLGVSKEVEDIARHAMDAFVGHFAMKGDKQGTAKNIDPQFYLNVGHSPLYMSGREYTDLLISVAQGAGRAYHREIAHLGEPDHDVANSELKVRKAIADKFEHTLKHIIQNKHGQDLPEFWGDLREWFLYTDKFTLGDAFKKQVKSVKTLKQLLGRSFENHDANLFDDTEFENYIISTDPVEFKEELAEFLFTSITSDAKNVFATFSKRKELSGSSMADFKTKFTKDEATKLEFIIREIIHALKVHDISNKMLQMVKLALKKVLADYSTSYDDDIDKVIDFHGVITEYLKKVMK